MSAQMTPDGAELVAGLAELLRDPDLRHLVLDEDGADKVRIHAADGWRRYELIGVDEDEHVLERMAVLDEDNWPVLAREGDALTLSDGSGEHYRGSDPDDLLQALRSLLQRPAMTAPIMRMRTEETADGFGMSISYENE
jgi:hypothetical protein